MIPWREKVPIFSINPDAASRDDIARMASELMEAKQEISRLLKEKEMSWTH